MRRETVPPPHLKYKLTKGFLMQSGAQIVMKHVHIVYLQCIYSLPCSPYTCVPPSDTQTRHTYSHVCGHVTALSVLLSTCSTPPMTICPPCPLSHTARVIRLCLVIADTPSSRTPFPSPSELAEIEKDPTIHVGCLCA